MSRVVMATACLLTICTDGAVAQVQPTYLYTLSNFSGRLRYDWVRINVDQERDEIYVIYQDLVRIFNPSGMEIFSFGDDLDLGHILDAVVDRNGDIILLSHKEGQSIVTRCNFRGVPIESITVKNLPEGVVFQASRMLRRSDRFYFVSLSNGTVIVTQANWEFEKRFELLSFLDPEERKKSPDAEVIGFTVDQDGNIFFSIPTLFRVYRLAPDGTLAAFGRPGSAAGRFGVIAGLATDSRGYVLVADKLKCVVMVFDKSLNFLAEFGYRGARPENLIIPDDIAVDHRDRVYVSQGRRRGVSVFALTQK